MAVCSGVQLRYRPEAGIDGFGVRERRKAAFAGGLITVHLRLIGLVDRATAHILSSKIECVVDLMFQGQAPLHEVRRMELAIRNRGNRNWRKARARIRQTRNAGKLALSEAGVELLIRRRSRIDSTV